MPESKKTVTLELTHAEFAAVYASVQSTVFCSRAAGNEALEPAYEMVHSLAHDTLSKAASVLDKLREAALPLAAEVPAEAGKRIDALVARLVPPADPSLN